MAFGPDGDPNTQDYPHVINNSWSFPVAAPISKNFFDRALARWRELGIIRFLRQVMRVT